MSANIYTSQLPPFHKGTSYANKGIKNISYPQNTDQSPTGCMLLVSNQRRMSSCVLNYVCRPKKSLQFFT